MDTRGETDEVRGTGGRVSDWVAEERDVTVVGYGAPWIPFSLVKLPLSIAPFL